MATTNVTDVALREDVETNIVFVVSVDGRASVSTGAAGSIELADAGVHVIWSETTGTAPDPVNTDEYTWFVPWSNVRAIKQNRRL